MEQVRIIVQGPTPGSVWAVAVPTTSATFDLETLPLEGLKDAIENNVPLVIESYGADVFYRFGTATGTVSEHGLSVPTATADQIGGVAVAGQRAIQAESYPRDSRYLIAKSITATGTLRIRKVG